MMDLLAELARDFDLSKIVVIVDLAESTEEESVLNKTYIAKKLSQKLDCVDSELNLEQLYSLYVKMYSKTDLIFFLASITKRFGPPKYYEILHTMNFKYIVEAHPFALWFDFLINKQFDEKDNVFLLNNDDITFGDNRNLFVGLYGNINYDSSHIVLTESEHQDFIEDAKNLSVSIRSILKNDILFLDFNQNSNYFKRLYNFICRKNGRYPNKSILITNHISKSLAFGIDENLYIVNKPVRDALEHLRKEVIKDIKKDQVDMFIQEFPEYPYKYLDSYEESDELIFFGRKREIQELTRKVRASNQVAILTAKSGFGKTSLIKAGLIPNIRKNGDTDIIYIRAGKNPWYSFVSMLKKKKIISKDEVNNIDIKKLIQQKYLLLIIDQFEECLVNLPENEWNKFDKCFIELIRRNPQITLLVSIRQDFVYHLSKLKFISQEYYSLTYNLKALDNLNAKQAIIEPLRNYGFEYDEGLVDLIIEDLRGLNLDVNKNYVDPTQLQIVCDKLYNTALSRELVIISLELYHELGDSKGILESYIEDSLGIYGGQELSIIKSLLGCFVSSQNTKIKVSREEVLLQVGKQYEISDFQDIKSLFESIMKTRLIIPCDDNYDEYFELAHEYIINKIREWMDEEGVKLKESYEFLKVEMQKWDRFNSFIPVSVLNSIKTYREKLSLTSREIAYIIASIIKTDKFDESLVYWINRYDCENDLYEFLIWLTKYHRGYGRILAGTLLCIVIDDNSIHSEVIEVFQEYISPHFLVVESDLRLAEIEVNDEFVRTVLAIIEEKRFKNMVYIPKAIVKLGLSYKDGSKIIKEYDFPNKLRKFFPKDEREVSIDGFYIDKYMVTNKDYSEFKPEFRYNNKDDDYPVVGLTLKQAADFAEWWGKSIPTEDEWEYSARGNDFRFFPWGNIWDYDYEKKINESEKKCNTSLSGTDGLTSVFKYKNGESVYGCLNMAGTAWEWTTTNAIDSTTKAIIKGGSWSLLNVMPWLWYRFSYDNTKGYLNVGFRCVIR
ncbi:SUMF1/EgtB/PvdO family nonheme iron enzyme [Mycoplasmatota bacterium WC44]